MNRQAYTSTVVAPLQLMIAVLAAAVTVALGAVLSASAWPLAVVAVVIVAVGVHLCTVRLVIGRDRILIGQGPWGRPARVIATSSVLDARATTLGWAQIFGVGVPFHRQTSRLTIRPGAALCLKLRTGERIRISTADPDAARRVFDANSATDSTPPRRHQ